MRLQNNDTQNIISESEFRTLFPWTYFPQQLTNDNISGFGYSIVNDPQYIPSDEEIIEEKRYKLWQACSDYEKSYISGVGLSILALGVARGKPKALAVAMWSQNLWGNQNDLSYGHYYPRKAKINVIEEPNYDFSEAGPIPYTVSELAVEAMSPD